MDMNHFFSRMTSGWISPQFKVIYSFNPINDDPTLQTVFDDTSGMFDRFKTNLKSLPSQIDRMVFVRQIASDFNSLMNTRRRYMDEELNKIRAWISA